LWNTVPSNGPGNNPGGYSANIIKTYICPSEASSGTGMCTNAGGWAGSNYMGNYYVMGNPAAAASTPWPSGGSWQGRRRLTDITDGTSNVVVVAESYINCGSSGNIWNDASGTWNPVFCGN